MSWPRTVLAYIIAGVACGAIAGLGARVALDALDAGHALHFVEISPRTRP